MTVTELQNGGLQVRVLTGLFRKRLQQFELWGRHQETPKPRTPLGRSGFLINREKLDRPALRNAQLIPGGTGGLKIITPRSSQPTTGRLQKAFTMLS